CADMRRLIAGAPAGTSLAVAVPPELKWFEPLYSGDRSIAWGIDAFQHGAIFPNAPGHASGTLTVHASGRYAVWVQGDFPRPVPVQVDGRLVGTVSGSNTPGQWLQAASLQLGARAHTLRISRAAGQDRKSTRLN